MEIRRLTETQTDTGETSRTWSTWKHWHASVEPIARQSRERYAGSALQGEATHEVTLRYCDGLLHSDRIWLSRRETYLEILELEDIKERRHKHFLTCKEVR